MEFALFEALQTLDFGKNSCEKPCLIHLEDPRKAVGTGKYLEQLVSCPLGCDGENPLSGCVNRVEGETLEMKLECAGQTECPDES